LLDKKVNLIDPVYKKHLFLGQDFWVSRVQISEFCNKEQNTFSDHCWVLLITSISNFYLKLLSQTSISNTSYEREFCIIYNNHGIAKKY